MTPSKPGKAGMVATVEPGIYVKMNTLGFASKMIYNYNDGCINLSQEIIKEVEDIEKLTSE